MPATTREKLTNRLSSARALLRQLSQELHEALPQITREHMSTDEWFSYRELTQTIQNAANDAAQLTATMTKETELTTLAAERSQT